MHAGASFHHELREALRAELDRLNSQVQVEDDRADFLSWGEFEFSLALANHGSNYRAVYCCYLHQPKVTVGGKFQLSAFEFSVKLANSLDESGRVVPDFESVLRKLRLAHQQLLDGNGTWVADGDELPNTTLVGVE